MKNTTAYWLEILHKHDIPAMARHTLETLLLDPHLSDVGLLERVEHPTQGTLWNISEPSSMTGFSPSMRLHAPHIGEQTVQILREIGYPVDRIAAMLDEDSAFTAQVSQKKGKP